MVGISSRCPRENLQWLMDFLQEKFGDLISEVNYLQITNRNRYDWEDEVKRTCSVGILYHSKLQGRINVTDVQDALYDEELRYLCNYLGKEKVLVVLDDMEDNSKEEKQRILYKQRSLQSCRTILIPEYGKHDAASRERKEFVSVLEGKPITPYSGDFLSEPSRNRTEEAPNLNTFLSESRKNETEEHIRMDSPVDDDYSSFGNSRFYLPPLSHVRNLNEENHPFYSWKKFKVSIFSRAASDNYRWLVNFLMEDDIRNEVEVQSVYISKNYQSFCSGMFQCNFAILYHTKNQGRLNITNVTDALYDHELQELNRLLGKRNIIVVVDDMSNTSDEEKERILCNQRSIRSLANDLFLFEQHKDRHELNKIKENIRGAMPIWTEEDVRQPSSTTPPNFNNMSRQRRRSTGDHSLLLERSIQSKWDWNHYGLQNRDSSHGLVKRKSQSFIVRRSSSHQSFNFNFSRGHISSSRRKYDASEEPQSKKVSIKPSDNFQGDCMSNIEWIGNLLLHLLQRYSAVSQALSAFNGAWQSSQSRINSPTQENLGKLLDQLKDAFSLFSSAITVLEDVWWSSQKTVPNSQNIIEQLLDINRREERTKEKYSENNSQKNTKEWEDREKTLQNIIVGKEKKMEEMAKIIQEMKYCIDMQCEKMPEIQENTVKYSEAQLPKLRETAWDQETVFGQLYGKLQSIEKIFHKPDIVQEASDSSSEEEGINRVTEENIMGGQHIQVHDYGYDLLPYTLPQHRKTGNFPMTRNPENLHDLTSINENLEDQHDTMSMNENTEDLHDTTSMHEDMARVCDTTSQQKEKKMERMAKIIQEMKYCIDMRHEKMQEIQRNAVKYPEALLPRIKEIAWEQETVFGQLYGKLQSIEKIFHKPDIVQEASDSSSEEEGLYRVTEENNMGGQHTEVHGYGHDLLLPFTPPQHRRTGNFHMTRNSENLVDLTSMNENLEDQHDTMSMNENIEDLHDTTSMNEGMAGVCETASQQIEKLNEIKVKMMKMEGSRRDLEDRTDIMIQDLRNYLLALQQEELNIQEYAEATDTLLKKCISTEYSEQHDGSCKC